MFKVVLRNSRIKYGKNFLEFFKSPVQLLDKTQNLMILVQLYVIVCNPHDPTQLPLTRDVVNTVIVLIQPFVDSCRTLSPALAPLPSN